MSAHVPLVMALDDPGAVLETVGGKGASLARLARAGFAVPPGFDVTTGAYLDFVERGGLREPMMAAMSAVDVTDPASFEVASEQISALFADRAMPTATAAAIVSSYAALGDDVVVAVRSSATAEDLPAMSAAGQQDTYLNIRGADGVLDAVRGAGHRCGQRGRSATAPAMGSLPARRIWVWWCSGSCRLMRRVSCSR